MPSVDRVINRRIYIGSEGSSRYVYKCLQKYPGGRTKYWVVYYRPEKRYEKWLKGLARLTIQEIWGKIWVISIRRLISTD